MTSDVAREPTFVRDATLSMLLRYFLVVCSQHDLINHLKTNMLHHVMRDNWVV